MNIIKTVFLFCLFAYSFSANAEKIQLLCTITNPPIQSWRDTAPRPNDNLAGPLGILTFETSIPSQKIGDYEISISDERISMTGTRPLLSPSATNSKLVIYRRIGEFRLEEYDGQGYFVSASGTCEKAPPVKF